MRTFLKTSLTAVSVTLGSLASFDALADLDVYKCKDTQGHLNYTDSPCIGSSKVVAHSKVAEHPHPFAAEKVLSEKISSEREPKAERATAKRKRLSSQSNVNVFAVNEKYNNQVFDERFKHPRTAELSTLNKNLDKIEGKRQRALKGDL